MDFRNYDDCENDVEELYKQMYINQSYSKKLQFSNILTFKKHISVQDAIYYLNKVVDSSDPDTTQEQIYHGYQTAEAIRKNYFTKSYLISLILCLIHNIFLKQGNHTFTVKSSKRQCL